MDKFILVTGLIVIMGFCAVLIVATDMNTCFEINGIDHNKNNEPFTVFIGDCQMIPAMIVTYWWMTYANAFYMMGGYGWKKKNQTGFAKN